MKIRTRMFVSFGIILLMQICMGSFGVWNSIEIDKHVGEVADVRLPSLVGLEIMQTNILKIMLIQRELLIPDISAGKTSELLKQISILRKAYKKGMDLYATLPQTKRETELWQDFLKLLTEGKELNNKFFAMEKEYRLGNSGQLYKRMAALSENKIFKNNKQLLVVLDEIILLNRKIADEQSEEIKEHASDNHTSMLAISIISIPVAVIIALLLTRSIVTPLRKAAEIASRLADGNLSYRMQLDRKDEIGDLANAVDHMAGVFTNLINEVRSATADFAHGKLRRTLQIDGQHNDYRVLVDNINEAMGLIVALLDALPSPIMIRDRKRNVCFLNEAGGSVLAMCVMPRAGNAAITLKRSTAAMAAAHVTRRYFHRKYI